MKRLAIIVVLSTGLIAGPAVAGHDDRSTRGAVGGVIGAAAGALIGSNIGDGRGRVAATAAGAVGGFLLGRQVAQNYHDGGHRSSQPPPYYNDGGQYRSSPPPAYYGDGGYSSHRPHGGGLYPINEVFVAREYSNVRAGPGTHYAIVDQLHRRERVYVVGKVKGRNWYRVRTGHVQGFVYAPLLRPKHHRYGAYPIQNDYYGGGPRRGGRY